MSIITGTVNILCVCVCVYVYYNLSLFLIWLILDIKIELFIPFPFQYLLVEHSSKTQHTTSQALCVYKQKKGACTVAFL